MKPLLIIMKARKTPKTSRSGAKSGAKRGQNKKIDLPADIKDERHFKAGGGGSNRRRSADLDKLIQPQKKCDKGDFREDELADRMGLARQYLRDIRKKELTEGKDWVVEGNAVILRNTAINTIIRKLELELSDIPEKAPPHLFQIKKFWLNKHMVGAVDLDGNKDIINMVWVANADMFIINQIIPVKMQKDRWVLACRQPRTKGKLK